MCFPAGVKMNTPPGPARGEWTPRIPGEPTWNPLSQGRAISDRRSLLEWLQAEIERGRHLHEWRAQLDEAVPHGRGVDEVLELGGVPIPDRFRDDLQALDLIGASMPPKLPVSIAVSDDGVGKDPSGKQHVGLGTSIVQALSQQLKASVQTSANSPGMMVTIIRP